MRRPVNRWALVSLALVALSPLAACKSAARQLATQVHRDEALREYVYTDSRGDLYDAVRSAAKESGFKLPKDAPDDGDSVESDETTDIHGRAHVVVRIDKSGKGLKLEVTRVSDRKVGSDKRHMETRDGAIELATLQALDPKAAKVVMKDAEKQGREDAERFTGCAKKVIDS